MADPFSGHRQGIRQADTLLRKPPSCLKSQKFLFFPYSIENQAMHAAQSPPAIARRTHFVSPLANADDLDNVTISEATTDVVEPPDVLDTATQRHADALGLLVMSVYGDLRKTRMCPHLVLPVSFLDGADLRWIATNPAGSASDDANCDSGSGVRAATRSATSGLPRSVSVSPRPVGAKNLSAFLANRGQTVVIDSPRSLLILLRNGETVESLRRAGDSINEAKRMRVIDMLQQEYLSFTKLFSQRFFVRHIQDAGKTPSSPTKETVSLTGSTSVSPFGSTKRCVPEAELPANGRPGGGSPSHQRKPRAFTAADLKHLQAHRDRLVIMWGMRQQELAEEAYVVQRVKETIQKARSTSARSGSPGSGGTRSKHDPAVSPLPSPTAGEKKSPEGVLPRPAAAVVMSDDTKKPPRSTGKSAQVDAARQEAAKRFAERISSVEDALREKEHRAAAAIAKVKTRLHHQQLAHASRARSVLDVNSRMLRNQEYERLLSIQAQEAEAAAERQRREADKAASTDARHRYKERRTLEYVTRKCVEQGASAIEKKLAEQEHAAQTLPLRQQRKLQEGSRAELLRRIAEEDRLLAQWTAAISREATADRLRGSAPPPL